MRELAVNLGLSGVFRARLGTVGDYGSLARFHYVARRPATFALIVAIDYADRGESRAVAAAVLSHPALSCAARERALRMERVAQRLRWAYINRHVRTISRVIVHPQFRGIGLAREVVQELLRQCPTRYVEAIARLAEHHGLFTRAGMARMSEGYFLYDATSSKGRRPHDTGVLSS